MLSEELKCGYYEEFNKLTVDGDQRITEEFIHSLDTHSPCQDTFNKQLQTRHDKVQDHKASGGLETAEDEHTILYLHTICYSPLKMVINSSPDMF